MNNKKEMQETTYDREETNAPLEAGPVNKEQGTNAPVAENRSTNKNLIIALALLVTVLIAGFGVWLWQTERGDVGRPVPAPRNVSFSESSNSGTGPISSDATVTLSKEQAASAGIKIEVVGEKLSSEGKGTLATGVVQQNTYRETPVISLVGGIVRKINAELGQEVRRGQTLAVVFSEDLSTAQSRYLTALAELDEHHKHHHRTMKLVEIGAVSREELEQAASKLQSAESELASLTQKLLLLGLTQQRIDSLKSTKQISSEVIVTSPGSGTITSRSANQGEVISINKELLRVTDLSSVWVIGQVFEKDLAHIRVGSGASITSDAYPGRVFRGQISYVDTRLDQATRTAQVRVELPNPSQMLKIGMYVNIAFAAITNAESVTPVVSTNAVQNINNQHVVFVATENPNVFLMRPIRLGPENNGFYTALEGISVGERIVTQGSFLLRAEWLKLHPSSI